MINWKIFGPAIVIVVLAGSSLFFQKASTTPVVQNPVATPKKVSAVTTTTPTPATSTPTTTNTLADTVTNDILTQAANVQPTTEEQDNALLTGDEQAATDVDTSFNANENGL
jgi:hypothetical protein